MPIRNNIVFLPTQKCRTAMPNIKPDITELFFALIRCGIGKEQSLPCSPSHEEWQALFDMSKKQTLAGITFSGIENLPQEQRPPKEILLQWYSLSESIKRANASLNSKASALSQKFSEEGFGNCILKGQGIAQSYPNPQLRTPGDIDIWLDGGCDRVLRYIRSITPDCKPTYHHVDFNISHDVEIEVHYRPTWMYSPIDNRRLQRYFSEHAQAQFSNTVGTVEGSFSAPTQVFNMVYIPIHIYRHLFSEGIGLRQILDYYYVLMHEYSDAEKEECRKVLASVGVRRFMPALMYVMQQVFHIDEEHMICPPNKKSGEFLMREIMTAGNFGHHDTRYKATGGGYSLALLHNLIKRSFILVTRYPSEVLWAPAFKIWHFIWRKRH